MNQIVRKSLQQIILRRCKLNACAVTRAFSDKIDITESEKLSLDEEHENRLGGFAKAFEKFAAPKEEETVYEPDLPFATLFRKSKFIEVKLLINQNSLTGSFSFNSLEIQKEK